MNLIIICSKCGEVITEDPCDHYSQINEEILEKFISILREHNPDHKKKAYG